MRCAIALAVVAAVGLQMSPAGAASAAGHRVRLNAYEARLVTLVNAQRAAHGLAALAVAAGTTDVARRWSKRLAEAGAPSHNPELIQELAAAGSAHWHWLGENVGAGAVTDPDSVFALYMTSPAHRDIILAPRARFVGVGVAVWTDGTAARAFDTLDVVDAYDDSYGASRVPAARTPIGRASALVAGT